MSISCGGAESRQNDVASAGFEVLRNKSRTFETRQDRPKTSEGDSENRLMIR